jgi:electron transfer flavoprotein beta subunit
MKILVGIKHVPDTETKIRLAPDGRSIDESGIKWILSPYDEFAIEQALLLREARGGEVVLACAGREAAQASLRQGLALGADRAVHLQDDRFERCDALVRARALASLARSEAIDLVLVGKYGVGTDEWLTGPMLAELLDWPHVAAVTRLELTEGSFEAAREIEGAVEIHQGTLPAVLTCEKGLNEPRYASLKGIMQAKKKTIETRRLEDLGLAAGDFEAPRLVVESLELPAPRAGALMVEGPAQEAAERLACMLREKAGVL